MGDGVAKWDKGWGGLGFAQTFVWWVSGCAMLLERWNVERRT
jgi:hypothetical protein